MARQKVFLGGLIGKIALGAAGQVFSSFFGGSDAEGRPTGDGGGLRDFVNQTSTKMDAQTAEFNRDADASRRRREEKNRTAPEIAALAANEYYQSLGSKQAATTEHQVWKNITQHG